MNFPVSKPMKPLNEFNQQKKNTKKSFVMPVTFQVRGEMREAYEEISGCPEEIIYPILGSMEIGTSVSEDTETQVVTETIAEAVVETPDVLNVVNVDDELRDANNYVCSEMLECSWPVDTAVNSGVNNNNTNINNSPVSSQPNKNCFENIKSSVLLTRIFRRRRRKIYRCLGHWSRRLSTVPLLLISQLRRKTNATTRRPPPTSRCQRLSIANNSSVPSRTPNPLIAYDYQLYKRVRRFNRRRI